MLVCLRSPEVFGQVGFIQAICFAISHLLHALQFRRVCELLVSQTLKLLHVPAHQATKQSLPMLSRRHMWTFEVNSA